MLGGAVITELRFPKVLHIKFHATYIFVQLYESHTLKCQIIQ